MGHYRIRADKPPERWVIITSIIIVKPRPVKALKGKRLESHQNIKAPELNIQRPYYTLVETSDNVTVIDYIGGYIGSPMSASGPFSLETATTDIDLAPGTDYRFHAYMMHDGTIFYYSDWKTFRTGDP